jgi:hypothetical protein
LRSVIIDSLLETPQVGVAYFYCKYNDNNQTAEEVLTNLLKQLARQFTVIPSSVQSAYNRWNKAQRKTKLNASELTKLFIECAKEFNEMYKSPVFVLLDAYDELDADDESMKRERAGLLLHLRQLYESGVKIYITTRPDFRHTLKTAFMGAKILEIKSHKSDIEIYLRERLKNEGLSPELKMRIEERIIVGGNEW